MGVSLEIYRISIIGIFISKYGNRMNSSRPNRKMFKSTRFLMIKSLLFVGFYLALMFEGGGCYMNRFVQSSKAMDQFENYSSYRDDLQHSSEFYVLIVQNYKIVRLIWAM